MTRFVRTAAKKAKKEPDRLAISINMMSVDSFAQQINERLGPIKEMMRFAGL